MTDKRKEIVEKVRMLYNEFGIRSVTMDDVVHELGISKKTLYQFFKDKSELITAVLNCESNIRKQQHHEAIKGINNAIEEMMKYYDFQMKMISEYNASIIYDLKKYYPKIHNDFLGKKRKGIYEGVLANLKRGKSEGLYRTDLDEEIVARLNLMRIEAFINTGIFGNDEIMKPSFFKELFRYHMYGIVNDYGRKILEQNIKKLK
jgi:TetR/AcrR family transcriptional regulator, cholesterol catabolism regulator